MSWSMNLACLEDLAMLVSFKVFIAVARFLLIITCSQINLYAFKLIWLYTTVATYPLKIISISTANSWALQWLQAFAGKEFM